MIKRKNFSVCRVRWPSSPRTSLASFGTILARVVFQMLRVQCRLTRGIYGQGWKTALSQRLQRQVWSQVLWVRKIHRRKGSGRRRLQIPPHLCEMQSVWKWIIEIIGLVLWIFRCGNHFAGGEDMYMQGNEIWHTHCEHYQTTENIAVRFVTASTKPEIGFLVNNLCFCTFV